MAGRTTCLVGMPGQAIRSYVGGDLLTTATRTGRGWRFQVNGRGFEAADLDGVLAMFGVAPGQRAEVVS